MEELVELWRRVDDLRELPDASSLSGDRALVAMQVIAKVRHASDALMAPYAARVDDLSDSSRSSRFARWKGFPNAAALLSHATGLSVSEAGKLIGLGRALADAGESVPAPPVLKLVPEPGPGPTGPKAQEPEGPGLAPPNPVAPVLTPIDAPPSLPPEALVAPLAAAIRLGQIGTEKATIIRRTLEDMTVDTRDAEALLVARARELSLVELRRLCLITLAERDPAGHASREARQRKARFVKMYEEPDGMITIFAKLDPSSAAPAKAWFEAELRTQVAAQRDVDASEQRSLGQIGADIFVTTVLHAAGCDRASSRPKSTIVVRLHRDSLATGEGYATCDGIEAPFTVATALAMAVDAEVAPLLLADDGATLKLGRTKRDATRAQRLAVAERDKGCAMCSAALSRCDAHHIVEWSLGGRTDVDNLVMLCVGCHHRIHDHGWGIVIENAQVWFIPPAGVDPQRRRRPGSSARLAA